ncbi:MAG: class I SAM-dependent methyltransferase [Patescibacteria group bacterium]
MNSREYAKMAGFEREYWWHKGRLRLVDALIRKYTAGKDLKILEIGCGTGEITEYLQRYGEVIGLDFSDEAIRFCKQRKLKNIFKRDITRLNVKEFTDKYGKFDLILTLDVMEHIREDAMVFEKIKQMMKENGIYISTMPAYKFLWSEHDESLHHVRRYHSLEIRKKLESAGFKIIKKTYFVAAMFPVIAFFRMWSNFFTRNVEPQSSYITLPKPLNDLMYEILKVETRLVEKYNLPAGTTLVTVSTI